MKKALKISVLSFALLLTGGWMQQALATDGYFGLGYGALNKGVAGSGVAWYKYSLINGNPAGNVFLGKQYDIGVGFFNPNREYTVTGNPSGAQGTFGLTPGTVTSDSKLFVIPNLGANWMINEKSSFSASLFGNGGMNTNYPTKTFYDPSSTSTGVNLAQMFIGATYSRKIAEKHSLGLTAMFVYQYFSAKGVGTFAQMSSNPTKLSGTGTDNGTGVGFKIGYMGQLAKGLSLGATYQPKIKVSKFDKYAGLFAGQGRFDIPSTWTVGLAFEPGQNWTFLADLKRINYTDAPSVSNPLNLAAMATAPLGSNQGSGFGWKDINVYKIGAEYKGIKSWTLRGGYSHCDQPVPGSEVLFNILAPGVVQDHLTLGFSKAVGGSGDAFHLALVYALPANVKGRNPMDPNQNIELKMNQLELELAFTF